MNSTFLEGTFLEDVITKRKAEVAVLNVANIELLKAAMRAKPQHYDQNEWWDVDECGSACCMAGWAYALKNHYDLNDSRAAATAFGRLRGEARAWLGLTTLQANVVFGTAIDWPQRFAFDGDAGMLTRGEQVEKACAFLDFLVAGGDIDAEFEKDAAEKEEEEDAVDDDEYEDDEDDEEENEEEGLKQGGSLAMV